MLESRGPIPSPFTESGGSPFAGQPAPGVTQLDGLPTSRDGLSVKAEVQRLLGASVIRKSDLSPAEIKRRHERLYFERPSEFIGRGADMLGKVRLTAYVYLRNSEGEFEQSTSLIRQIEPMIVWAAKNNVEILEVFSDPDTRGLALGTRPGMLDCLIAFRSKGADLLLVDELTRMSRVGDTMPIYLMLAQQKIEIIDISRGKAMTEIDIAFDNIAASRETKIMGRRMSGGTRAASEHRNKITKVVAWPYYRSYPGSPIVCLDADKAETTVEIHKKFDAGDPITHIVRHLNEQWALGIERYRPPGRAKKWQASHLLGSKRWDAGVLRRRDYIGEFWQNKTENRRDLVTAAAMQRFRDRDEWICVEVPHLAIFTDVKKENEDEPLRALWDRNQARLQENSRKYLQERGLDDAHPERRARCSSDGSGRRLLSSMIACAACGANFHYKREGKSSLLKCSGTRQGTCDNHFRLDSDRVTSALLSKFESEITDSATLAAYEQAIREQHAPAVVNLLASQAEIEEELAKHKTELSFVLRERTGKSGETRDAYTITIREIEKSIDDLKTKLNLSKYSQVNTEVFRKDDLKKCRSLLERLRCPETFHSKDPNDLFIVEWARKVLSARLERNRHDYGARLHVTIDLSVFFWSELITTSFKRVFFIDIPPREVGFRSPPVSKINKDLFENAELYRMDDETWAELEECLQPHWGKPENKYFAQGRHHYDAMFLSLRANAGPCTTHNPHHPYTPLSNIHGNLRKLRLWPSVLEILRRRGNTWVNQLDADLMRHLNGEGGWPTTKWVISPTETLNEEVTGRL